MRGLFWLRPAIAFFFKIVCVVNHMFSGQYFDALSDGETVFHLYLLKNPFFGLFLLFFAFFFPEARFSVPHFSHSRSFLLIFACLES